MSKRIRVGTKEGSFADVERFFTTHITGKHNGYPAYDSYPGAEGEQLAPQDLLASALLNALKSPLPAYYSLLSIMDELNDLLQTLDEASGGLGFHELDDAALDAIAALYRPLDTRSVRGIGAVTLSKVLHRKRPSLIPITDKQIRNCYRSLPDVGSNPKRSYEDYVKVWLSHAQRDLAEQYESFTELAELTTAPKITPLRALDIVGWGFGGGIIKDVS